MWWKDGFDAPLSGTRQPSASNEPHTPSPHAPALPYPPPHSCCKVLSCRVVLGRCDSPLHMHTGSMPCPTTRPRHKK